MLFLGTRRFIPGVDTIPDLSTPRSPVDRTSLQTGINPFPFADSAETEVLSLMILTGDAEVAVPPSAETRLGRDPSLSVSSPSSAISYESTFPLIPLR